jgi:hypothetical protein
MISSEPSRDQPTRPTEERAEVLDDLQGGERRARQAHVDDLPVVDPAAIRDAHDPPVAMTTRGSSMTGLATRRSASSSSIVSASTAQTYGWRAAFRPQFSASDLPPLSLSMTHRSGCRRET